MSAAPFPIDLPLGISPFVPKDIVARIPEDERLWVPRPAGNLYLPLMFDVSAGVVVNIIKYPVPGVIGRHVHDGPVYSWTIEGSWFYPEHDWVATPGTFVWEPAGEIHTLTTTESMTGFYVMHGGLTSVDENGKAIHYDNAVTLLDYCDAYYRHIGLGPDYIRQFLR